MYNPSFLVSSQQHNGDTCQTDTNSKNNIWVGVVHTAPAPTHGNQAAKSNTLKGDRIVFSIMKPLFDISSYETVLFFYDKINSEPLEK